MRKRSRKGQEIEELQKRICELETRSGELVKENIGLKDINTQLLEEVNTLSQLLSQNKLLNSDSRPHKRVKISESSEKGIHSNCRISKNSFPKFELDLDSNKNDDEFKYTLELEEGEQNLDCISNERLCLQKTDSWLNQDWYFTNI